MAIEHGASHACMSSGSCASYIYACALYIYALCMYALYIYACVPSGSCAFQENLAEGHPQKKEILVDRKY